jgi:Ser/Thr protein kinase RdoA (MazF antagonist)
MAESDQETPPAACFESLTPDRLLDAVEAALGVRLTGLAHPLASYINRVYELQAADAARTRYIAKFYRPGRWSPAAVDQEHAFVAECAADEIPVVAPLPLAGGQTRGELDGISFAVYPKRLGRALEPLAEEDWRRLGRVVARLHVVGARHQAPDRVRLHPAHTTTDDVAELAGAGLVTPRHRRDFEETCRQLLQQITPLFRDTEVIRIHGDCHRGNLLDRPGEGILVIDFDDMAMGPPVQDLWMLLPAHLPEARLELNLILEGYEDFREFDDASVRLVEPLRAMRILYFMAWCGRQAGDLKFRHHFPDWGTDAYWARQVGDLRRQLQVIRGSPA